MAPARKLAFVVKGGLHPSGREQVMPLWLALFEALGQRYDVHAFSIRHLGKPSTYRLSGFTVHDLGNPGAGARVGLWAEWQALAQALELAGPFDVVHGFWVDPGGLLAVIAGQRLGIPSVVTCDSGEFTSIDDIKYGTQHTFTGRMAVRTACRLATRVHVTTGYMEQLAAKHGCQPVRIPLGVDLARWTVPPARLQERPWRLLQVASLNPVKDQSTLLRAIPLIAREVDVRLDLVGENTLGGALRQQAVNGGIAARVFFHGYRPSDELLPFFHAAHVYVQSSRHEASGAAVLEAAATGLAIVGTRAGYVADWAPSAALAVDAQNPRQLADVVLAVLADNSRRERLGANARAFAETHNLEWSVRQLADLYDGIARRN